jgi:hypothetical protein
MRSDWLGPMTYTVMLVLRLVLPIGLTLLVGTLTQRYQAARGR